MAGNKTLIMIVVAGVVGVAVYMYMHQQPQQLLQHQTPVLNPNHNVFVHSTASSAPHEDFAFSDIKNTYVSGGHSGLQLATDSESENIGGILTNAKNSKGQVINVGMNLMNEFALGQRDDRVVESYVMHQHQYGAGTPNFRKLAGWY